MVEIAVPTRYIRKTPKLGAGTGALPAAAISLQPEVAFGARLPLTVLCLVLAAFLVWTHRSNLKKHFAARAAGAA